MSEADLARNNTLHRIAIALEAIADVTKEDFEFRKEQTSRAEKAQEETFNLLRNTPAFIARPAPLEEVLENNSPPPRQHGDGPARPPRRKH